MKHIDYTPTKEYHCCNYCKWYHPDEDSNFVGGYNGHCEYAGRFKQDKMYSNYLKFYDWGCIIGYQHTIHNKFNIPYPSYVKEYAHALHLREQLRYDVYKEIHKHIPTVYLPEEDMQSLFS